MKFNTNPNGPWASDVTTSSFLPGDGEGGRRIACSSLIGRVQGDVPVRTGEKSQAILDVTGKVLNDQEGGIGELPPA